MNVCVPFMFKGAVDSLNVLNFDDPVNTSLALSTSLLLGCKYMNRNLINNSS